jgi:hypothetical protein
VADYSLGIVRVTDGQVTPLPGPTVLPAATACAPSRAVILVLIRNGVEPARALRLRMSSDGSRIRSVEVLDLNHRSHREPTLCTVVGRDLFYIGAAQWERREPLVAPVVLTTRLE